MKTYKLSDGKDFTFLIHERENLILFNTKSGIFFEELNNFKFLIDNFKGEKLFSNQLNISYDKEYIKIYTKYDILVCLIPRRDFKILKRIYFDIQKYLMLQ